MSGIVDVVRNSVVSNPNVTVEALMAKLAKAGHEPSEAGVRTIRSTTLGVLAAVGKNKKALARLAKEGA